VAGFESLPLCFQAWYYDHSAMWSSYPWCFYELGWYIELDSSHFLPKVVHFKQAGFHSLLFLASDAIFCYLSKRGPINFHDPSVVYIKFLFPIDKQYSIDSFLDWEGHYWLFRDLYQITAPHSSRFHCTPYQKQTKLKFFCSSTVWQKRLFIYLKKKYSQWV